MTTTEPTPTPYTNDADYIADQLTRLEGEMGAENVYEPEAKSADEAEASMDAAMNSLTALLREACGQAETVVASVQDGRGQGEGLYSEDERAEIGRTTAQILAHLRVLTRAYTETDEPTGFAEVMRELDDLAR